MRRLFFIVFLLSFFSFPLAGKDVPPPSGTLVTDYVRLLSDQQRNALERKLVAYDDSTSTQIAIVIDQSLEGEEIFDYSLRLAEAWGIGQAGKDNGILIYIAFGDRKMFIQTGYGTEGFLPDALAKRIIETVLVPAFRQERYYEGLDRATDIIIQIGSGEYTNDGEGSEGGVPVFLVILIFLIILIVLIRLFSGGGGGGGYTGGGRYDSPSRRHGGPIIFPGGFGGGGGGGFGGFGGGGGFGGFGGGGFGGGGAGGSW